MSNIDQNNNPENIIDRLKNTIQNGEFGIDYTISQRDKNKQLKQDYNLTDEKIIKILKDLEPENFIKTEPSNNLRHPNDTVYIFKKNVMLMPRWIEYAEYCNVRIYIKITWPDEQNSMFIISFHEDNK